MEIESKKMDSPVNFVIVGNMAFDVNTFPLRNNGEDKIVINNGGAAYYSLIPASIHTKTGIVSRIGNDFDINLLKGSNIDLSGLVIVDEKTTRFHHTYSSLDGQVRTFRPEVYEESLVTLADFPDNYYRAQYIHLSTNFPQFQLDFIKKIRENSNALISIDTHEAYVGNESRLIKEIFDMVDIAFIDKEFTEILDCKAPIKIIKMGKTGCKLISKDEVITSTVSEREVIDKTGAGDVLTGTFMALLSKGESMQKSLDTAVNMATESISDYGVEHLKKINVELDFEMCEEDDCL